jgi:hypothetical protein
MCCPWECPEWVQSISSIKKRLMGKRRPPMTCGAMVWGMVFCNNSSKGRSRPMGKRGLPTLWATVWRLVFCMNSCEGSTRQERGKMVVVRVQVNKEQQDVYLQGCLGRHR